MNLKNLLPDSLPFKNTPLKDAPLVVYDDLKFNKKVEKTVPVIDQKLSLLLEPEAGFKLCVINSEDDIEDEEQENFYIDEDELKSILQKKALVNYSLYGRLKGNANLKVKDILGFEISTNQHIELSQFTTHDRESTINDVLLADLTDYKNLLLKSNEVSFWDNLKPYDALAYTLDGDLDLELSVNGLKLLSVAFAPVFALTGFGPKIPLKLNPSLGLTFKATKNDSFCFLISKREDGRFKLFLKKNKQKEDTLSITGGLSVRLTDSDAEILTSLIGKYFEKYLEKPLTEIEKLLDKAENTSTDEYLRTLAEKIGFDGTEISGLKERFDTYKEEITEAKQKVLDIVTASVEIGLKYEYRKAQTKGVFLEAYVTKEILTNQIRNILTLNIGDIITRFKQDDPGIEVISYLAEKKLTIEERFSFGISLGNWALKTASKQTYEYDEKHTGTNAKREIKLAFLDEKIITNFGEEATISVSLDAETPTPESVLCYNELDYTFTLISSKTDKRIRKWDKKDLHRFLQTALTWNIFEEDELDGFFESIWNSLLKDKDVEYKCKLHIPRDIFPGVIKALSLNASVDAISEAMAAAILPNNADERSLLVSARKEFYKPLISGAFQKKDILKCLDQPLYQKKYKKWRRFEIARIQDKSITGTDCFMGISDNGTFKKFQSLISGINLLNDHIQNHKSLENDLKKSILKFFFDAFHAIVQDKSGFTQRWLGYYLFQSVEKESPELLDTITNTLEITYLDNNNKKDAILIGG